MFGSMGKIKCFLCSEISDKLPHEGLTTHLFCKNCGEYVITLQAERVLELNQYDDIKYLLSSQTFENYYYEHKPLTIKAEHIENAKDLPLLEKLYKLSRYLYHETKERGLGSKIDNSYLQFYCRNNDEYFKLLETLKSMNIIEFEKYDSPSGSKGTFNSMYDSPKLLGNAMLAFEEGIDNIEDFKRVFMTTKIDGDQYNFNINDGKNQFNLAQNGGKITAIQNNSLDITELNTLIENIVKSLPQDIHNEKRNEVTENLEFIRAEAQSPNPRKTIIKNTLLALKAIVTTAGFLASLTKLAEFFNLNF
jgi:hypothetical protein